MPPAVTFWTGNWNPTREALSKQIETLRAGIAPSAPVVAFASGNRTRLRRREGVLTLSGRRWLLLRAVAAALELRGRVTHAFGAMNAWHLLRSLGRRPMVLTVAIPGPPIDRRLYDKVALFAAETKPLADSLAAAGVARERIRIVYPGVDLDRLRPAATPTGRFTLLFASTPADPAEFEARGLPLLVELARRRPDVDIVLLWRRWGDERGAQRALAALRPPANVRVEWGDVPDMASAFHRVHAVVACFAPGSGKSCPNSVIEGLACGRPALLTDTCGIAELVASEGAGRSAPRTAEGLAEALDALRADYDLHASSARALAERRFDSATFVAEYRAMYEQLAR